MKKLLFALCLLPAAAGAQSFTSCTVARHGNVDKLKFSVNEENNVRYYIVEGSNDSADFEMISRVNASGNGIFRHNYAVQIFDINYKYYRVRQVDLMAATRYTAVLNAPVANVIPTPAPHKEVNLQNDIATLTR